MTDRQFQSNDEFFAAVRALAAELETVGDQAGADDLKAGLQCLNGLTDGWALVLESLQRVHSRPNLSPEHLAQLEAMETSVRQIVYR